MYRCLFLIIAVFALNGCVIGEQSAYETRWVVPEGNRAFDTKVMQALNYEKTGESKQARDAFLQIYKDYQSEQALENAFMLTLFNNLDKGDELNELAKSHLDKNAALARFSAVYHLQNGELQAAQSVLERLVKWDKDFRNYELLGDVAAGKRNFKQALAHYKQSKAHLSEDTKPNEVITLKIAESELLLGQSKNAQKELESFVDELDCTARVCLLLAKIYNDKGENAKLEATYLRLYELTRDESFVRVLLERMMFEEKYEKALEIALKYEFDDDLTLFLYQRLDKFREAYELALKRYEQSKDKKYLLIAAVMEFEEATNKKKINQSLLSSVSKKFEQGLDEHSGALYLNYYGYLLIDYDLDVPKGIDLVKQALKREPHNLFYLDSLSWGYYKQGQCGKAWNVMLQTMHDKEFSNSQESKEHIKAIQQCLSKGKR